MNGISSRPFGLRFEEHPIAKDFIPPIYDEDEDISVYFDRNGYKVPAVEYYGNLGTTTLTKVQNESSDEDPDLFKMGGTRTLTEIQNESSDSDDDLFTPFLGTITGTAVQSEQSDEDPSIDAGPKPPVTTRTVTNVVKEITDQD